MAIICNVGRTIITESSLQKKIFEHTRDNFSQYCFHRVLVNTLLTARSQVLAGEMSADTLLTARSQVPAAEMSAVASTRFELAPHQS